MEHSSPCSARRLGNNDRCDRVSQWIISHQGSMCFLGYYQIQTTFTMHTELHIRSVRLLIDYISGQNVIQTPEKQDEEQ